MMLQGPTPRAQDGGDWCGGCGGGGVGGVYRERRRRPSLGGGGGGGITKLRFVFKFSTSNCSLENNYKLKISFVIISQAKPEESARL